MLAPAEIIDRIAVSVGDSVITTSDLDREIRVNAFLSGAQPDFSPAARRAAAERMVEQQLIRRELEVSKYPVPAPPAADFELQRFRASNYKSDAEFQKALSAYGITEQQVKDQLLWQLTLLRFVEVRFRPGVQVSDQEIQDYFEKVVKPAAQKAHPGAPVALEDYRSQVEQTLIGQRTDQDIDAWLKQARKRAEIVFHEEAFR